MTMRIFTYGSSPVFVSSHSQTEVILGKKDERNSRTRSLCINEDVMGGKKVYPGSQAQGERLMDPLNSVD